MSADPSVVLLRRLPEAVVSFRHHSFRLGDDLAKLHRVHAVGAHEAAVLYGSRILEVITAVVLEQAGLPSVAMAAADLDTLYTTNLLPVATHYWAHALRRTGNDARHIRRAVEPGDASTSMLFVERLMHWYFCRCETGPTLPDLTLDGLPLWRGDDGLHGFITSLERAELRPESIVAGLKASKRRNAVWLVSSSIPAALAERLIEMDHLDEAGKVLDAALTRHPDDLRLRQLRGLHLSASGQWAKAQHVLEELRTWNVREAEDAETCGILAGVYKRRHARGEGKSWLERSHDLYLRGWRSSRETNTYLGINAATTALWLGLVEKIAPLAARVRLVLDERRKALKEARESSPRQLRFWDQVTLAEALLLLDNRDEARAVYLDAFEREFDKKRNINTARRQALTILRSMGVVDVEAFFG